MLYRRLSHPNNVCPVQFWPVLFVPLHSSAVLTRPYWPVQSCPVLSQAVLHCSITLAVWSCPVLVHPAVPWPMRQTVLLSSYVTLGATCVWAWDVNLQIHSCVWLKPLSPHESSCACLFMCEPRWTQLSHHSRSRADCCGKDGAVWFSSIHLALTKMWLLTDGEVSEMSCV